MWSNGFHETVLGTKLVLEEPSGMVEFVQLKHPVTITRTGEQYRWLGSNILNYWHGYVSGFGFPSYCTKSRETLNRGQRR
jgi:hypothetical protein